MIADAPRPFTSRNASVFSPHFKASAMSPTVFRTPFTYRSPPSSKNTSMTAFRGFVSTRNVLRKYAVHPLVASDMESHSHCDFDACPRGTTTASGSNSKAAACNAIAPATSAKNIFDVFMVFDVFMIRSEAAAYAYAVD